MARLLKAKKEHIGLSPHTIHFKGEKKSEEVLFEVIDYDSENLDEIQTKNQPRHCGHRSVSVPTGVCANPTQCVLRRVARVLQGLQRRRSRAQRL